MIPHTQETKDRFIEMRASGRTFEDISNELNVSRPTLIHWSRIHQFDIQNLKAIRRDALNAKYLEADETRLANKRTRLVALRAELETRKFSDLSTSKLVDVIDRLEKQMTKEAADPTFSTPTSQIPSVEKVYAAHDWKA